VLALVIGLTVTPQRRSLGRPRVYVGGLLAGALMLPHVLWQRSHGWPFLEFSAAATGRKNMAMSPLAFLLQQIIYTGRAAAVVWLCGLWACLIRPRFDVVMELGQAGRVRRPTSK
jgi:hypothetical protein